MGKYIFALSALACWPALASSVSPHGSEAMAAEIRPNGQRPIVPLLDLAVASQTDLAEDLVVQKDSAGLNMNRSLPLETEVTASLDPRQSQLTNYAFENPPSSTSSEETSRNVKSAFLVIILFGAIVRFFFSPTFYAFVENVLDVLSPMVPY